MSQSEGFPAVNYSRASGYEHGCLATSVRPEALGRKDYRAIAP